MAEPHGNVLGYKLRHEVNAPTAHYPSDRGSAPDRDVNQQQPALKGRNERQPCPNRSPEF